MDARATDDDPTPADLREWIENVFAQDPFSLRLGIELVEVVRGRSLLRMPVGGPCMNVHGGCHGGAIWTLADLAFGIAGAYDGPILTIGSDLTFFRPAGPGTCLYATGGGRSLARVRPAPSRSLSRPISPTPIRSSRRGTSQVDGFERIEFVA